MSITRAVFEQQCKRRFGTANPERMRLAHWEWMVRHGGGPYGVRCDLGLEPNYPNCGPEGCSPGNDPDWCFSRFGMSRTKMPDGRIICIAGEHEDFYDPDFCIYNDVIVLRPAVGKDGVDLESGEVEVYGYLEAVFAPTDFHSATLVRERLYIVGRLGYAGTRIEGTTPIVTVNSSTYEIDQLSGTGPAPGWIYRHHASYDETRHAIVVRGGSVHIEGAKQETPYFGAHRLHLDGLRWEVLSHRETHRRFLIEREDKGDCEFLEATGTSFSSANVPCRVLPPEDRGVPLYGLDVMGVRVTFMEFCTEVRTLVEGDLPPDVVDQLMKDVLENLRRDTKANWTAMEVQAFSTDF